MNSLVAVISVRDEATARHIADLLETRVEVWSRHTSIDETQMWWKAVRVIPGPEPYGPWGDRPLVENARPETMRQIGEHEARVSRDYIPNDALDDGDEPDDGTWGGSYCRHGTYIGTPGGADFMCGACEAGE